MRIPAALEVTPSLPASYSLTEHARWRISIRGISEQALGAAVCFGRVAVIHGAEVFAIGRRQVQKARWQGIDLSPYEGVSVVCSITGRVITAYRNRRR